MKTYRILLANCEDLLNDYIESLFQEVCRGRAQVRCVRTGRVDELVRHACEAEFDLIVQVPHNLSPESAAATPLGLIGEGLQAVRRIKSQRTTPVITIAAPEERSKYEALLLEAGADCVLELPFDGEELRSAIFRLLRLPARLEHFSSPRWFFAGVVMRGLRLLRQV